MAEEKELARLEVRMESPNESQGCIHVDIEGHVDCILAALSTLAHDVAKHTGLSIATVLTAILAWGGSKDYKEDIVTLNVDAVKRAMGQEE